MIGEKFGRLTVLEELSERTKSKQRIYLCECECGNYSKVARHDLRSGNTKSCGCIVNTVFGLSHDPLYSRCHKAYERTHSEGKSYHKSYTERNIQFNFKDPLEMYMYLLSEWNESIKKNKIDCNLQIDRIDNEKGYEPGNVRITTRKENNRNRSNTIIATIENLETGEKVENVVLSKICEEYGLNYKTLHARLKKNVKKPLTDPWIAY